MTEAVETTPESKKTKQKRNVREIDNSGKAVRKIKGLPRTNMPVVLPDDPTFLKQPRQVTYMRYDFNMGQLRIFLSIIECLQSAIEESITKRIVPEQLTLFKDLKDPENIYLQIPIKDFGFKPDRYDELKKALLKMVVIPVELDCKNPITGEDSLLMKGMFEAIIPKARYSRYITIKIERRVAKHLVDANGGFTKFIKEIATSAKNKYTVRIYFLICSWRDKGGFRMEYKKFRNWLQLGDKYQDFKDLHKRVIFPCYKELHEKADCWFELDVEYAKPNDKEPSFMNFKVIKAAVTIQEQEKLKLQRQNIENLLFNRFHMPERQIKEILKNMTLDNIPLVNEKMGNLFHYMADHQGEIKHTTEYAYKALMKVFDFNSDYEDVTEKN